MPSSPAASFSCSCLRELGQPVDRGDHLRRRRGLGGVPLPPQDRLKRAAVPPPVGRHRVAARVRRGERQQRAGCRSARFAAALACAFLAAAPLRAAASRPGRLAGRPPARPAAWPPAGRRRPGTRAAAAPGRAARRARRRSLVRSWLRAGGRVERSGAEGRLPDPCPPDAAALAWRVVPRQRRHGRAAWPRACGARREPGAARRGAAARPAAARAAAARAAAGRAPRRPRPRGRGAGRRRRSGDACRWLPLRRPGSPVTCHHVALRTETPADEPAKPLE